MITLLQPDPAKREKRGVEGLVCEREETKILVEIEKAAQERIKTRVCNDTRVMAISECIMTRMIPTGGKGKNRGSLFWTENGYADDQESRSVPVL